MSKNNLKKPSFLQNVGFHWSADWLTLGSIGWQPMLRAIRDPKIKQISTKIAATVEQTGGSFWLRLAILPPIGEKGLTPL